MTRRIERHRAFRALVPLVSPGDTITINGEDFFVDEGKVVHLDMCRLLFGEGGAVAGYCCLSRAVVIIICKVLALANGAYIDDFGAVYWAEDTEDRRCLPMYGSSCATSWGSTCTRIIRMKASFPWYAGVLLPCWLAAVF